MPVVNGKLRILVCTAQFPFPARFGFATRVYHLTRQLAARHEVTLVSYVGPHDADNVEALRRELRVETVVRQPASLATKRATQALSAASRRPFACRAVYAPQMQAALDRLCARERFDVIQLESSLMCAFRFPRNALLILDEHNLEYEVFERMQAGERSLLRRAFHGLEHRRFRRFERHCWRHVAGCAVTSEREARIVRSHAPQTPTVVVPNGVDLDYFRPSTTEVDQEALLFNGLLQYRPNLDAAYYLVDEIWPLLVQRRPEARLGGALSASGLGARLRERERRTARPRWRPQSDESSPGRAARRRSRSETASRQRRRKPGSTRPAVPTSHEYGRWWGA
jgi:polysaccharide biosynthesis protein PslH